MIDRARILLAQHAETTRLLGVDFLPLGRPVEVAALEPVADEEPRPASRPAPKREFAPAPQAPSALHRIYASHAARQLTAR